MAAEQKTAKPERQQTGGSQTVATQDRSRSRQMPQRWSRSAWGSPFDLMNRMTEEMDDVFERVFGGFGLPSRSWSRGMTAAPTQGGWMPRIEAFQQGDRFIVRADLPGMKKDDVQVEITENTLTIQGERHEEHQNEREGYFHSEREYGQFFRAVPLPEGVIAESAEASFRSGVLEITMQAPPSEANRGRKLEIREGSSEKK